MNRVIEPGRKEDMTWRLLVMAMVISFFMGVAFLAVSYSVFKLVWG